LSASLPKKDFKVFSNIPFSLTSDIVKKITDVNYNLKEAFLFVQKESAERFLGKPKNTQIATILSFMYETRIIMEFSKEDFKPVPKVEIVLLNFKRRNFKREDYRLYKDFITYIFNQRNICLLETFKNLFTYKQLGYIKRDLIRNKYLKPTDIQPEYYIKIFQNFKFNGDKYISRIDDYHFEHLNQHLGRQKVNRTRI
jgi:23S rRNA (adenine-N6)-dimethyltransferase